jgi:cytosine/adenosine deaminase-related metal-dependent hydrolase
MPNELTLSAIALPDRSGVWRLTLRGGLVAPIRPDERGGDAHWLALPGLVNLHAHADRAYTVQSFRPGSFADAWRRPPRRARRSQPPT